MESNGAIKLIRADEFLVGTPAGRMDFERSLEVLQGLAAAGAYPADYEIILDLRKVDAHLSLDEMRRLVEVLVQNRYSFRNKIALLVDTAADDVTGGKLFESMADREGFIVDCFTAYESALEWLYPPHSPDNR